MSSAAPRDRRDHDTSLPGAAAVAALVMLAALAAQFSPQRAAAQSPPCTAIQDDAERLRCYDQALRSAPPPAPAPTVQTPAAPPAQTSAAPGAQSASVNASSATAPPAPAATAPPPQQTQQQTPQQSAGKESIRLVIVGVRTLQGRETIFTTQDGATWVQNDSQRIVGLPAPPFEAELKRGAVGSQFLVPKNGSRAIRVREGDR